MVGNSVFHPKAPNVPPPPGSVALMPPSDAGKKPQRVCCKGIDPSGSHLICPTSFSIQHQLYFKIFEAYGTQKNRDM
jgi:hypothetical protein